MMKLIMGLWWGVAALPLLASAADTRQVVSDIKEVTVYADRARVTREGHLALSEGESEWVFDQLPAAIIDASVQVSGKGVEGTSILDVTTRQALAVAAVDPRLKGLEEELVVLEGKDRVLKDRGAGLEKQTSLVSKIEEAVTTPGGKEGTQVKPSFDEWQKLLTFSDETRTRLAAALRGLADEQRVLDAEIAAKRAEIQQLEQGSQGGRAFKTVTVRIAAKHSGDLDLKVAYTVGGAGWRPTYDARLKSDARKIELTYFGVVQQNTGEDWKKVALVLSTARPSLGGAAPELMPWWLSEINPMVAGYGASVGVPLAKVKRARGIADGDTMGPPEGVVAQDKFAGEVGATSNGGLLSYTASTEVAGLLNAGGRPELTSASFVIAAPATVLSDYAPQKVGITVAQMDAALTYASSPRLMEAAFLSAAVKNTTEFPFLAGAANVFLDDTLVTTATLKTVMPGEGFDVALGADEGIAVKRRVVNRFHEDTGLTGGGRRVTYEYRITVANKKKTAEKVVIREVLPVSRNEKIVVKLLSPAERELSTAEKPKEVAREEGGRLVWTLDLKPEEKREITVKFSVDYPGDLRVDGLE